LSERQRIDVWLFRARFAKTRAAATRLITEGGVRIVHDGVPRRLEKPSVEVEPDDVLLFHLHSKLIGVRVVAIGARRGPASEARALYRELDAEALA
jgi:ribosome-associated heat shock protein Hsp15